ncbi:hypothetical protein Taro_018257, partial [Colocasia esculenta]|nr:hypothetical protein [Colocasia esculenta]
QRFGVVLAVLPHMFARCLALEGLSRLEVVSVSWDPHPREPVEGGIRATSVLELAVHDAEGFGVLSWRRPDSPLSHCLSLHWFRSHIVVSEAGAGLASRACGLRVPLLAASRSGLVAVVVTTFSSRRFRVFLVTRASGGSRFGVLSVPWSHSWVPAPDGTGVCSFPTWRCVRGPGSGVVLFVGPRPCRGAGNPYWALFARLTPYFLQLGARRRGSSVSNGLRRRLWRHVVVSSSVSECCVRLPCKSCALDVGGLQLLLSACVASVVARCVRAVLAQLVVDSLAVVFSYGGHLQASPGAVLLVIFGAFERRFGVVLVVLPRLFAQCLALEGLSRSEVVSVSWDPHPREPVEGGVRATSVLELAAHTRASGGSHFGVLSVPWSHSWVPARDGTGVCSFPTWQCVRGLGWFCLWALDLVEF